MKCPQCIENLGKSSYKGFDVRSCLYCDGIWVDKEVLTEILAKDPAAPSLGLGLQAIEWLKQNPWKSFPRIRLDVLINNRSAASFWRAAGFEDYCITMEANND